MPLKDLAIGPNGIRMSRVTFGGAVGAFTRDLKQFGQRSFVWAFDQDQDAEAEIIPARRNNFTLL